MREIKFRAWEQDVKFMNYSVRITVNPFGNKETYYKVIDSTNWIDVPKKHVMQYTGLKDKKGVDIYEGDILTKKSFWPFYIGFENGCFVQIPCNKTKRKNRLEFSRINTYVKEFELVGNIYENPDLVEV